MYPAILLSYPAMDDNNTNAEWKLGLTKVLIMETYDGQPGLLRSNEHLMLQVLSTSFLCPICEVCDSTQHVLR
jgi:hypothetical protein